MINRDELPLLCGALTLVCDLGAAIHGCHTTEKADDAANNRGGVVCGLGGLSLLNGEGGWDRGCCSYSCSC